MTHRDDLAAVLQLAHDGHYDEWLWEGWSPMADAVIAYYKANPTALLALIRERFASGTSQAALAREFGMTPGNVWHIVRGNSWRQGSTDE